MARKTEFQRFVEKIRPPKDPVLDCWEWIGSKMKHGHGQFGLGGKAVLAHRYSFENSHLGPCVAGLELDHLCRNPSCVNPNHLEQVTHRENMSRGRSGALKPGKTSRFVGVRWHERQQEWRAEARSKAEGNRKIHIGSFDSEEEAAKAYLDFIGALDAK